MKGSNVTVCLFVVQASYLRNTYIHTYTYIQHIYIHIHTYNRNNHIYVIQQEYRLNTSDVAEIVAIAKEYFSLKPFLANLKPTS